MAIRRLMADKRREPCPITAIIVVSVVATLLTFFGR